MNKLKFFIQRFWGQAFLFLALASAGQAQQHSADCWLENKSSYRLSTNFVGTQPTDAAIRSYMETLAVQYTVPIEVIAVIGYKESTLRQYNANAGSSGFLIHNLPECKAAYANSNAPVPPGLGLMQLTGSTASDPTLTNHDVLRQITDWQYNLEAGVQVLVKKYKAAIQGDPTCLMNLRSQTESQKVLENWFYAIQFYNGSGAASISYRDDAYAKIANPPPAIAGWFPPVNITRPETVIPNFTNGTQGFCALASGSWTNYQCNTYNGTVHISSSFGGGTPADLALQSFAVTHGTYKPGDTLSIPTFTVANLGDALSSSYSISYYLSTNTVISTSDTLMETSQGFSGLSGHTIQGFSAAVKIPPSVSPGNYYVGAIVNVADADSANNSNFDPTTITISGTPTPTPTATATATATPIPTATATATATPTMTPVTRIISLSDSLAFGNVAVETTTTRTLTITNNGNSTLSVSGISYPPGFSGAFSGQIGAGGFRNVTVTFAPTTDGSYGGAVVVNSDATGGTSNVSASGYGLSRVISLSGNLAFGSITVGTTPSRTLRISNNGNSTLNVSGISYPAGFSGAFSGQVASGGFRDVTVTFAPSAGANYGGTVTVISDATSGGNTITASGAGILALSDFDHNGTSDMVWQDRVTGQRYLWLMSGAQHVGSVDLGTIAKNWDIAAIADLNGDGQVDILWQDRRTGQRYVWLMTGTQHTGNVDLGIVPTEWDIVGAGDFNGDGRIDILWQNRRTGQRYIWLMTGVQHTGVDLGIIPTEWDIAGTGDFNGDNQQDILWQNRRTGQRYIWLMTGTQRTRDIDLGIVSTDWDIAATGDYNFDQQVDILWQNRRTGQRYLWLMTRTQHTSDVDLGTVPVEWDIAGSGDYIGEGQGNIFWQEHFTGQRYVWLMSGTQHVSDVDLGTVPTDWDIATTGDFNADREADIVWQNRNTGQRYLWFMSGGHYASALDLGTVAPEWDIVGAGDVNGDGYADILWQNRNTGQRYIWFMAGSQRLASIDLGTVPKEWDIVGVGDFNEDGYADLLWQNRSTGQRYLWFMMGSQHTSSVDLGVVPTQWDIVGTGDFNGDGQSDILWQDRTTGQRYLWLMTGAQHTSSVDLGYGSTAWEIRNH